MIGARVMSQLDLHIEQKIAQRDSIDLAARRLAGRPGWIIEFGLGRGRSYSHLVERFPDREIYCFDRQHAMDPGGPRPPTARLILGDLAAVLADAGGPGALPRRVILAHLDLAWGDATDTRCIAWSWSGRAAGSCRAPHPERPRGAARSGVGPGTAAGDGGVGHAHRYHRYELRAAP